MTCHGRAFLLHVFCTMSLAVGTLAQTNSQVSSWISTEPGFRAINITSNENTFWVCGVGKRIASSTDGQHWQIRHENDQQGATLLGVGFTSPKLGYAYGTGGVVLTTEDGGSSWTKDTFGTATILQASLTRRGHGLVRTRAGLFFLNGSDTLNPVVAPAGILQRFSFVPSLVALNEEKMGAFVSEGPYSEGGYLTTSDGGKTWSFFDPPNTGVLSFLGLGGKYWASGHEVVGKDKPGGGYGVPMAAWSEDGQHWNHVTDDIRPCHWENCGVCTRSGCLASGSLLVNFFQSPVKFQSIPKGPLSAKWAAASGTICSIQDTLSCASLGVLTDLVAAPAIQRPSEQSLGPLQSNSAAGGLLQCIACSLEPVFVDDRSEGRYKVQLTLLVRADGTMEQVTVENAPSIKVASKIQSDAMSWLFEPPVKDGKSTSVRTQAPINIVVVRPR